MNINKLNKTTVNLFLPTWCSNIFHNERHINKRTNLSNLICKSFPICHKLEKLKKIHYSDHEYTLNETMLATDLPSDIIKNSYKYCNENFQSYIGTSICNSCKHRIKTNKSALVISGGPSLNTHKHLDILSKKGFNGDIFCVSAVLKKVLEYNITPKYFVVLDPEMNEPIYISHDIIHNRSNELTGLFSVSVLPETNNTYSGNRYFYNPYIESDLTAFNIFSIMTHCPAIYTGGNVGTTSIMLAALLGYNPIVTIGYDLSFQSIKEIESYYKNDFHFWKQNPKNTIPPYTYDINPHFNKKYYITSVFSAFRESALFLINSLTKSGTSIINCTEQGSVYSKSIKSTPFQKYLDTQN